jgi:hypothetical protein
VRHPTVQAGLILLMVGLLLQGCVTPAVQPRPETRPPAADSAPDSPEAVTSRGPDGEPTVLSFDPLRLPERPIPLGRAKGSGQTVPEQPPAPAPPAAQPAPDTVSQAPRIFWCVQLYSGRSPASVQSIAAEARLLFPEHRVEVREQEADLKVLVGDFDTRESADGLKQRAVRLGFGQAWVITGEDRD